VKTNVALMLLGATLLAGCAHPQPETAEVYPYYHPLSSPGTKFGGLPPAVQNTVRAEVGGADLYDIAKSDLDERVVYTIYFRNPELFQPLYVESDGSVLYPDKMTVAVPAWQQAIGALSGGPVNGIKVGDLPIKVANTIQEKAPTAEVAYIDKVVVGSNAFYEVTFKNPARNPKILIAENGVLIEKDWK